MFRTIKRIHSAVYRPIDDLITYSPLPTPTLDQIDPFIFLNHHGPQIYPAHNHGLPFGPHPHRGMETVTFILQGDIAHRDSSGHQSVITSGGIQWMTAGSGLIHAETSSERFLEDGGPMEILQLWLNLPAKYKMTPPFYKGLQEADIPVIVARDEITRIQLISGSLDSTTGPITPLTDVFMSIIHLASGSDIQLSVPDEKNIFLYVVHGHIMIRGQIIPKLHLAEFNNDGHELNIKSDQSALILCGHAIPFNEPKVARGPFVMNTEQEIYQAYQDYHAGKFGSWTQ